MNPSPPRWTVPGWDAIPGLCHGFFGRAGGVSQGVFASLNLSKRVGDEPSQVHENGERVARSLGVRRLSLPLQAHGSTVVWAPGDGGADVEADALLVRERGLAAAVLTADCVPIFLVAPEAGVAAVVHAGWKGTALGIARLALEALREEAGPASSSSVHAALGPAIGGCCFEVGEEVVAAIGAGLGRDNVHPMKRGGAKAWLDLRAINRDLLVRAGIEPAHIHLIGPCTRCTGGECFSHRGSGGRTGRQVSAIGWV